MIHNNEAIRQAVSDIVLYDSIVPPRMLDELRAIVRHLDKNMREKVTAVHESAFSLGSLGIDVTGLCEITIEHQATDTHARITIDDGEVVISSNMSGQTFIQVSELLTGLTE